MLFFFGAACCAAGSCRISLVFGLKAEGAWGMLCVQGGRLQARAERRWNFAASPDTAASLADEPGLFFLFWSEQVTRAESSNQRHPSKGPARERRNLTNATL
jgi:hypothetical protein